MFDDEDIIMPDEEEVDTPTTPEAEGDQVAEQTSEATPAAEDDTEKKLLEYLNTKDIKYNGEKVTVNSIDDLINTYQKGMNYDKLKAKSAAEDDEVLSYINEKAKQANLTSKEYIEKVKDYERRKEQELMQTDIQNMVSKGIDEVTARRVAETEAARKEFEKERQELQKLREEEERKQKENKEYEDFISAHPDIKPETIPAEVFQRAKDIGLNNAYLEYENKQLIEKIKQLELNKTNASTSPVGLTSDGSSTEQESKDAFLEGFDSVL